MSSNSLRVSALFSVAVLALTSISAMAIPAGPLPIPGAGGKLAMIPAGPLPIPGAGGKLS